MALDRVETAAYDLILCDWRMPELNGLSFFQALQNLNADFCRLVIFLTGDVLISEIEAFLDQSQAPRLHKPFNVAACRQIVHQVLPRLDASDDSH